MSVKNYAFLIKADGYPVRGAQTTLPGDGFTTHIFAASNIAALIVAAQNFARNGIEVIETCGGFSDSDFAAVENALDGNVALGRVTFDDANQALLARVMTPS
ncbi:DUF6506 family protein [Thalassospira alkalitolerans]|uniref:DUF6506 family protein n=1 Tax=Thalassospira alkalitolerans TaxID=1293890 RepID=UPI0030ED8EB6|tara:strand:- start:25451 stop:25756 length:306 start_codon:yes stop_codon:yes gene_type:complete